MASERCGILQVKLVVKNMVIGLPGTHFMYVRVKLSVTFF